MRKFVLFCGCIMIFCVCFAITREKHVSVQDFFCDEEPIVLNLEKRNVYFYCIDDQFTVNVSGSKIPIKEFLLSNDDAFSLLEENLQRKEGPSDGGTQIYKSKKGPSDGGTQIYKSKKGSEFSSKGFTYIRCNRLDGSNTDIYIGPIELTYQNNFCK